VGNTVFDRHNNGFIHFVANDDTDSFFDCHWIWGERGLQNLRSGLRFDGGDQALVLDR
jgi:hypothetical protein